jgi:hypothetical protein
VVLCGYANGKSPTVMLRTNVMVNLFRIGNRVATLARLQTQVKTKPRLLPK